MLRIILLLPNLTNVISSNSLALGVSIRKVQSIGGESAGVTLPKSKLRELGIISESGELGERYAHVEHIEGGEFRVELVDQ